MSTFDATSLLNQFHANLASITTASVGAFSRSAYRFTLDKEPDSGPDGRYSIDLSSVAPFDRKFGTGENVCTAIVSVRVAYARLGGDFGGGDRQTVNRSAASDSMLIADVCENPDNYNSSDSGISVVVFDGFSRAMDLGKSEVWETRFRVTFRTDLHTSPVQDLMVASLITDSTTALSALSVLSLASGTGAVIPATATARERLFFLDKENLAGDAADGVGIIAATGTGSPVWREKAATADPGWATAPFWSVSWSTGSDTAVGWGADQAAADLVPVKTLGEVFRRVSDVSIAETVIHVLDSQPESEIAAGGTIWTGLKLKNIDARVRIIGEKTAVSVGGGFTGVITGYTAADPANNGDALVAIATLPGTWSNSGPSGTSLIGKMIQKNDGTKTSFILRDAGGKTARIGVPDTADPMGTTTTTMVGAQTDFVIGETVVIYDLPELSTYPFGSSPGDYQDNLILGDVRLHRATEGANMVLDGSAPNIIHCRLTDPVIKGGLPTAKLIGCLMDGGPVTVSFWAGAQGVQLRYLRMLGTCLLMNNCSFEIVLSCDVEGGDGVFSAFAMQDGINQLQTGAASCGFFRCATPFVAGNHGSTLTNLGSVSPIYGSGNSGYIITQPVGTTWKVYRTGLTATTSLAHPLSIGGVNHDYADMNPHIIISTSATNLLDTV